jgi:glutamate racemase
VVACNTATAGAIDYLPENLPCPFYRNGAGNKTRSPEFHKPKHIGVLATEGTFNGRLFNETKKKYTKGVETHVQIGHGLGGNC